MNAKRSVTVRLALAGLLFVTMAVLSPPGVRAGGEEENKIGVGCNPTTGMPTIEVWNRGRNKGIPVTTTTPDGKTATYTLRTDNAGNGKVEYGKPGELYSAVSIHFGAGRQDLRDIFCPPPGPKGSQGQNNPASDKTAGNNPGKGIAGDPVSTSIGEYFFDMPLFDLDGPLPLWFALNYAASMDKSPASHNDPFGGDNFSHSLHIALKRVDDANVVVFFGNGNVVQFQKSANGWLVVAEETGYQLNESDGHYYLLDPIAEIVYTFAKSGALGMLTRAEDRNGNALTFANDAAGRVTRVDDGLGRSLTFTYANPAEKWDWPHLVQVTDAYRRTVKFGYQTTNEPVLTTHLTRVSDPLGATTVFTYTGPITNSVVAAVMYPRGNTPYRNQYSVNTIAPEAKRSGGEQWAVNSQTDALGNATRLAFDGKGVTTITDPLGHAT